MRITIIPSERAVTVDGMRLVVDMSFDTSAHAIQWYGDYGTIEYKVGGARHITDYEVVRPFVDAHAAIVNAPAPAPTQEEIIALYEAELDNMLDGVAKEFRFADRTRLALRAAYPNEWQALAIKYGTWMDACNAMAWAEMRAVIAEERPMPTVEGFIAMFPEFEP